MAARGTNRERYRKGKRLAPRCDRYQCPSPNTSRQRQQPEGLLSTGSRPKGSGDDSACTQQGASAMPVRLAGGARASSHSHRQPPQRPDSAVWGRGGPAGAETAKRRGRIRRQAPLAHAAWSARRQRWPQAKRRPSPPHPPHPQRHTLELGHLARDTALGPSVGRGRRGGLSQPRVSALSVSAWAGMTSSVGAILALQSQTGSRR